MAESQSIKKQADLKTYNSLSPFRSPGEQSELSVRDLASLRFFDVVLLAIGVLGGVIVAPILIFFTYKVTSGYGNFWPEVLLGVEICANIFAIWCLWGLWQSSWQLADLRVVQALLDLQQAEEAKEKENGQTQTGS